MLATAFFDLLPEAVEQAKHLTDKSGGEVNIFLWAFLGFLTFFLLERTIHWSHHHQVNEKFGSRVGPKPVAPLIVIGDSVHNFIDGVVIASTFLVSIPLGIVTSFAVAAHEIPQEIGDFGILLHRGMNRGKVLLLNILSALTSMIGAILTFYFGSFIDNLLPIFLAIAGGFFIYIAASDLIPEIHNEEKRVIALTETLMLIGGAAIVWISILLLEGGILQ